MAKSVVYYPIAVLLMIIYLPVFAADEELLSDPDTSSAIIGIDDDSLDTFMAEEISSDLILADQQQRKGIEDYVRSIAQQEALHGVYHQQVGEQLLGLGLFQQNNDLHRNAVETFTRALHITKVNYGLEALEQIPIVEQLITSNNAIGDWEALDQNYGYLYWLHKRAYGVNDIRLLSVINRVGLWNIDAYSIGVSTKPFGHLLMAEKMYENAINIIETEYGEDDSRLINYLYGIALTNYEQASHALNADDFEEVVFSTRAMNDNGQRMIEEQNARQALVGIAYRNGKNAMLRVLDIFQNNPSLADDEHAMAYLHMGDWYLLFNKKTTASESYKQAYAMLEQADSATRQRLFGKPRSLPALQFALHKERVTPPDEQYVVALLDVTKTGQAKNVEILEMFPADDKSLMRRAKKTIRFSRFRPRFENGEPVPSTGVNIRYVFDKN